MKESIWGWWFIVLGIIIMSVVMLVTDMTTTSEQNYYMIKEISEAAMYESVDYAYYRKYGELRISSEKFMENFIRRFSSVITINKTTEINFYDIYESPPKITVEVKTRSSQIIIENQSTSFEITNRLDAILEMKETEDPKNSIIKEE